MQIVRHYDEIKLLDGELRSVIVNAVEQQTGRKVKEVIFHSGCKNGAGPGLIGAATIILEHDD